MLALIAVLWVLVTYGPARPRLLCLLLVLPPSAWRIAWSYDDLTPLYLLLLPAWGWGTPDGRMRSRCSLPRSMASSLSRLWSTGKLRP